MAIVLRATGIAMVALILLLVLKSYSSGFASFVKIAAIVLLFGIVIGELYSGVTEIKGIISGILDSESFVGESISVMLKALGIALIGRLCADICRECGENGLAQGVESVVGIVIFSLSVPILARILSFAAELLGRGM